MRLKVTVSWIASSPVTRRDVTTTSRSQNGTSAGADFYECSMQALVHRWQKCIANGGNYVEK
jgi:hypothetical protein